MTHDAQFSIGLGGGRAFIDCFGSGNYKIVVRGVVIQFDWSDGFGPLPMTKSGAERHLSWRHPFWRAASLWNLQGMRVEDGFAIWHEPKSPVTEKRGRQTFIVDPGEPGWDW